MPMGVDWFVHKHYKCAIVFAEGGESQNGDDDSSDSEADEPSLSQEPKAPSNPSTGGGSQPGSAVHRPRGTAAALLRSLLQPTSHSEHRGH